MNKDIDKIIQLEPGEFELRKAFEETATKNIRTVIEYSTSTRNMLRELEDKFNLLEGKHREQQNLIDEQRKLIANLQVKLFSGGTV